MAHPLPPLNWLRAFEATARHLSFTHAAHELGLSQVAVSKQVKLLEQHLGEQMFQRHARSLTMTKMGEAYWPKVRDAFGGLSASTQEVFGARKGKALRIRCSASFCVLWLAPRLPKFQQAHSDISIQIISSIWNRVTEAGQFDLDIRYGAGEWEDGASQQLTFDTITPVCSSTVWKNMQSADPENLAKERLIHILGFGDGWSTWLRHGGISLPDQQAGINVDTSLMAFELAANGGGVAMARSSLVSGQLAAGRLVAPFKQAAPVKEAFHLVTQHAAPLGERASIFKSWLMEQSDAAR